MRRTILILGVGLSLSIPIFGSISGDRGRRVVNNIVLTSDPDSDQRIHVGAGDDVVYGRGGQDEIRGEEGDDTLYGNEDDDLLTGGPGDDIYGYARGDGNDTILETIEDSGTDALIFSDIGPSDVRLRREGDDVIITIAMRADDIARNTSIFMEGFASGKRRGAITGLLERSAARINEGGSIVIKEGLAAGERGIEGIRFNDGTMWSKRDIAAHVNAVLPRGVDGPAQSETVRGTAGDDLIIGLEGSDTLSGSFGADAYIYASGHGFDVIDDGVNASGEKDSLRLVDLTASDILLLRDAEKLMVVILPTGETITVEKQFVPESDWGIEKLEFSDGVSWDKNTILERTVD